MLSLAEDATAKRVRLGPCSTGTLTKGEEPEPAATRLDCDLDSALRAFVRLRTVSADSTLREDCFRGAKYLASLLESLGQ